MLSVQRGVSSYVRYDQNEWSGVRSANKVGDSAKQGAKIIVHTLYYLAKVSALT